MAQPKWQKGENMIINIPLRIDAESIEKKAQEDYSHEVKKMLVERIEKTLLNECDTWHYGRHGSADEGMRKLVVSTIDMYVENNLDAILDYAVERLEGRLKNRKRIKEVAE